MKKLLLFTVLLVSMVSCLDDDDDTNPKGELWGVVLETAENTDLGYNILLDVGEVVYPISNATDYEVNDLDRIVMYCELLDDWNDGEERIKIENMIVVPSHDLLTYDTGMDSLGSDPLAVVDGAISQTHKYLNVSYSYHGGTAPTVHSVNLVHYADSVGNNGGVFLKLQHNANDDLAEVTYTGYKCFDMASIPVFAEVTDSIAYTIMVDAGDFSGVADCFEGYYYAPEDIE